MLPLSSGLKKKARNQYEAGNKQMDLGEGDYKYVVPYTKMGQCRVNC
jgi:hypothetical protein